MWQASANPSSCALFACLSTVVQVPDSGRPSDVDEDDDSVAPLHEGDEGDVWSHKTVNGFRWYRVNVLRRPLGSAPVSRVSTTKNVGCYCGASMRRIVVVVYEKHLRFKPYFVVSQVVHNNE